ncbi:hypothetical protein TNIN_498931 [Trichonephila inaurata madagascariensis]|uniref:Uncharacterized protein n=1 Tax=Trichonephila inaurata madagascariensis TaxID=2747483 RepID=A0A8X6WPV8_9ARAC|nr:hypothetical protein TNIN_498931 [Trichonephila inaurata madagascariensis]
MISLLQLENEILIEYLTSVVRRVRDKFRETPSASGIPRIFQSELVEAGSCQNTTECTTFINPDGPIRMTHRLAIPEDGEKKTLPAPEIAFYHFQ